MPVRSVQKVDMTGFTVGLTYRLQLSTISHLVMINEIDFQPGFQVFILSNKHALTLAFKSYGIQFQSYMTDMTIFLNK